MTRWVLAGSLYLIAAAILAQALLAGFFISGTSSARIIHLTIGAIVPYVAILPTVLAWRRSNADDVPRLVAIGTTGLLLGLFLQDGLGHMPFQVSTVIHVPLGVLLFWLSSRLAALTHPSRQTSFGDAVRVDG